MESRGSRLGYPRDTEDSVPPPLILFKAYDTIRNRHCRTWLFIRWLIPYGQGNPSLPTERDQPSGAGCAPSAASLNSCLLYPRKVHRPNAVKRDALDV